MSEATGRAPDPRISLRSSGLRLLIRITSIERGALCATPRRKPGQRLRQAIDFYLDLAIHDVDLAIEAIKPVGHRLEALFRYRFESKQVLVDALHLAGEER